MCNTRRNTDLQYAREYRTMFLQETNMGGLECGLMRRRGCGLFRVPELFVRF
jgi:hypothetical protein